MYPDNHDIETIRDDGSRFITLSLLGPKYSPGVGVTSKIECIPCLGSPEIIYALGHGKSNSSEKPMTSAISQNGTFWKILQQQWGALNNHSDWRYSGI